MCDATWRLSLLPAQRGVVIYHSCSGQEPLPVAAVLITARSLGLKTLCCLTSRSHRGCEVLSIILSTLCNVAFDSLSVFCVFKTHPVILSNWVWFKSWAFWIFECERGWLDSVKKVWQMKAHHRTEQYCDHLRSSHRTFWCPSPCSVWHKRCTWNSSFHIERHGTLLTLQICSGSSPTHSHPNIQKAQDLHQSNGSVITVISDILYTRKHNTHSVWQGES